VYNVRGLAIAAATALLATAVFGASAQGDGEPPAAVITGETVVGQTITAAPGTNFKWQRCLPAPDACGADRHSAGWIDIGVEGTNPSYVLAPADLGHLIRVLAKDTSLGTQYAPSPAVGPVTAPPLEEEQRTGQGPIFDQTGNVEPTQGTVQIELPNGEVRQIQQVTEIPVGSIVDVSNGHAILTTQRKPGGPLQSTEEWGAAFKFDQKNKGKITQLTITDPIGGSADRAAAERRRGGGGLWGRGRCKCRTHGQNSSGTARGTFYLVKDTNKGTFTKVKHGEVVVKDFRTGEKVVLKKGESYLARNKRG
jgi:hypothetical protein